MKASYVAIAALFLASVPAFCGDVTISLAPATATYPPGQDTADCQINGVAPCVVFAGNITDNDTDGSWLFLTGVTIDLDPAFFTVDNTFDNDASGGFEGDADNDPFPESYTGPIFGVDINPLTPFGVYNGTAEFSGNGGTGDPGNDGFAVDEAFTINVVPEPATGLLTLAFLTMIGLGRRSNTRRRC